MNNKPQLFCFTHAGGTAAFFDVIEADLDGIDIIAPEYAGHGTRYKDEFYMDYNDLAEDMFQRIKKRLGSAYALFGYSMGSITVVEVLKRIIDSGLPQPYHVFLAAHEPYVKAELVGFTKHEMDEWVKRRTIEFGAVPEKLLNNKVFWRTYLPLYRADYAIIDGYAFEKLALNTDISTTVFYSETDTPLKKMRLWENYFTGDIEYRKFPGTHFFIQEYHKEMAQIIRNKLGAAE